MPPVFSSNRLFPPAPIRVEPPLPSNNDDVGDTPIPAATLTAFGSSCIVVTTTLRESNGEFTVEVPLGRVTLVETNSPAYVDV